MPLMVSVLPSDLARTRGGGERYAFELHAALRDRLPEWSSVGLVGASDGAHRFVPDGWRAVGGAGSRRLPSADAITARDVLSSVPLSADLVVCHQWRTRATAALRIRHRVVGDGTLVGIDYGGGSVAGYRLNRIPLPPADVGAHISAFEAAISPVKARRHQIVRGGTDPQRFAPPRHERRDYDFLMVGRFLPHKGQRLFLDALPPEASALLIGPSDTDAPAYLEDVKRSAASRNVDLCFDASDEQLVTAYQRARYTVQVPVETIRRRGATPPELLGLTMLEAMACGSLPICPSGGPSAEFVHHGRTGFTYDEVTRTVLASVLSEALGSETRREEMRREAVDEAARWTWPAAAEALLSLL